MRVGREKESNEQGSGNSTGQRKSKEHLWAPSESKEKTVTGNPKPETDTRADDTCKHSDSLRPALSGKS